MREIKFRAWDEGFNMMRYFDSIWNKTNPDYVDISNLMQYTGLKDKNGKEIYEGDIVNVPYNRIGSHAVKFIDGKYNIVCYKLKRLEIIGNIHENPELLK